MTTTGFDPSEQIITTSDSAGNVWQPIGTTAGNTKVWQPIITWGEPGIANIPESEKSQYAENVIENIRHVTEHAKEIQQLKTQILELKKRFDKLEEFMVNLELMFRELKK